MEAVMDRIPGFENARREVGGLLAPLERKLLHALAAHMPAGVNSDHLTALAFVAMVVAGAAYAWSRHFPHAMHIVNLALFVHWFGDSLDGTLARYRKCCRPRYGFYVDHALDTFAALFLLVGLSLSGWMSPLAALALLVAYYLVSINVYLSAYTLGVFKISYGPVGATELRIIVALANLAVLALPRLTIGGVSILTYDLVGLAMACGLLGLAFAMAASNIAALYRLEPLASVDASQRRIAA
jgi:archaetidylinositol phosphate synthase